MSGMALARSSDSHRGAFVPPPLLQLLFQSPLFLSFPLLHGHRASALGDLQLSASGALLPTEGYDATSEKIYLSRLLALVRWPSRPYYLVDHLGRGPTLGNNAGEVLGSLGSRRLIHVTALDAVPPLPSTLVNESIPSLYISTVVNKCRVSTLTGYLIDTSSPTDLHRG